MASEKKWRSSRTSHEQQFEEENTRTKSNVYPVTEGNRMEAELAQPLAKNETSRTILMRRGRAGNRIEGDRSNNAKGYGVLAISTQS